ncbi:unnamed protein product [Danaus chrysippus]|uniref:(African queen) hypothetical protein n=1 Tax=Danaus chrysippus TaxID=151541 RepID=A0A8J2R7S8_9NEOP|nr:unnamed protein product [Danaus chrysippus]
MRCHQNLQAGGCGQVCDVYEDELVCVLRRVTECAVCVCVSSCEQHLAAAARTAGQSLPAKSRATLGLTHDTHRC